MGPTWDPSGADRTQVGPMLATWTLLSGKACHLYSRPMLIVSNSLRSTLQWFFNWNINCSVQEIILKWHIQTGGHFVSNGELSRKCYNKSLIAKEKYWNTILPFWSMGCECKEVVLIDWTCQPDCLAGQMRVISYMVSLLSITLINLMAMVPGRGCHHEYVIKWKHFPCYWPFVRSPVNSPHKGHRRRALMFSLICVLINGWVNNREAGHLRCYHAHYDVIVMFKSIFFKLITQNSSLGTCCDISLRGIPQNYITENSTMADVMHWCHHTPSHQLSQCWLRSRSPYCITVPQWVKGWGLTSFFHLRNCNWSKCIYFIVVLGCAERIMINIYNPQLSGKQTTC